MKIGESIGKLDTLGRVGALGMASGVLLASAALGLNTLDDIRVNDHQVVDVPEELPVVAIIAGSVALGLGQRILSVSFSRQRQSET